LKRQKSFSCTYFTFQLSSKLIIKWKAVRCYVVKIIFTSFKWIWCLLFPLYHEIHDKVVYKTLYIYRFISRIILTQPAKNDFYYNLQHFQFILPPPLQGAQAFRFFIGYKVFLVVLNCHRLVPQVLPYGLPKFKSWIYICVMYSIKAGFVMVNGEILCYLIDIKGFF